MIKKFAIQCPYSGVSEDQSSTRIIAGAKKLGIEARALRDSHDIIAYNPDFVLCLSHQDPKLTPFPTYGLMTAPTSWYETPRFIRNILTYDGYLTVTPNTKVWLEDQCFGARKINTPVGFYANTLSTYSAEGVPDFSKANLVYIGTNWDGNRHQELFEILKYQSFMEFYGPKHAWPDYEGAYKGALPFDEESVLHVHRTAGVGLCLEHPDFSREGIPTCRIFETLASGAVAICSRSSFNETWFKDSVLYVDETQSSQAIADQIKAHMTWIRANPGKAQALAAQSHEIFKKRFAVETMLENLFAYHTERQAQTHAITNQVSPRVGVIMRAGGRGEKFLDRAIRSVHQQTHKAITLYLVLWDTPACLKGILSKYDLPVVIIEKSAGSRSDCLWEGLRRAKSDDCAFIGILDDDDEYHPAMISTLVSAYTYHSSLSLPSPITMVTGGSLKAYETPVKLYFDDIYDDNSLVRTETHHIQHFHFGGLGQVSDRSFVTSSPAMLVVTSALDDEVLQNPRLDIAEDYYLWLQLAERGRIIFAPEIVSTVHMHGEGQSGYEQRSEENQANHDRIARRMLGRRFHKSESYLQENPSSNLECATSKAVYTARQEFEPPTTTQRIASVGDLKKHTALWLYGASQFGNMLYRMLKQHDITPEGIADTYQTGMLQGHKILSPEELAKSLHTNDGIIISSIHWAKIAPMLRSLTIHNTIYFIEDPLNSKNDTIFQRFP